MLNEIKKHYRSGQILEQFWVDENDKIEGEYKCWFENGLLAYHYFYHNELKEGEYKEWYSNGQLSYHCFYKNGLKEGEYKIWFENGQTEIHCFFRNDKAVDISEYVADINNITNEEYFHLQLVFGYFPLINFDGIQRH